MKSFKLEIKKPCNANLDAMTKTNDGFFCSSCTKNVIDFSTMTNSQIAHFIDTVKDKNNICARLNTTQLQTQFAIEAHSKATNLKYAVAVAATVLVTSNVVAQENKLSQNTTTQQQSCKTKGEISIVSQQPKSQNLSFVLKGKVLNEKTKKPIVNKQIKNLKIYILGAEQAVDVNPKTGEFSIPITFDSTTKELFVNFTSNDYSLSKTYTFNAASIKKNVLKLNFMINPQQFEKPQIAGGLGINYIEKK